MRAGPVLLPLQATYNINRPAFDDVRFAMVDTLFSLAEAYLFMQVVELKVGRGADPWVVTPHRHVMTPA